MPCPPPCRMKKPPRIPWLALVRAYSASARQQHTLRRRRPNRRSTHTSSRRSSIRVCEHGGVRGVPPRTCPGLTGRGAGTVPSSRGIQFIREDRGKPSKRAKLRGSTLTALKPKTPATTFRTAARMPAEPITDEILFEQYRGGDKAAIRTLMALPRRFAALPDSPDRGSPRGGGCFSRHIPSNPPGFTHL